MKTLIPRLLRWRFAVPLLIAGVFALAIGSELTYQRAKSTLTGGIELTDARIGAARLLQLLTDAETAQRGYLLTENDAYLQPLRDAQQEFNRRVTIFDFIRETGPTGPEDAKTIRSKVDAKIAELDRTVAMSAAGNRAQALALVQTDAGKQLMDELREIFRLKLEEAARLQQTARTSLYDALWYNRILILLLSGALMIGLYLHLVQLRTVDQIRADHQLTLEKSVAEKTRKLRTLATWLDTVREDEKAHLARELHDELGGLLTGAKLNMARMRMKLSGNTDMLLRIEAVNQLLNAGIAVKRKIIEDLRPSTLILMGLQAALEKLCVDASQQMAVPVTSTIADVKLHPAAELALFRVAQEALTNIGKYAEASQVSVQLLQSGDDVHLDVIDNGVGFDVSAQRANRHGVAGMRFRMESFEGTLVLVSAPGQGTRVLATLSIHASVPSSPLIDESVPAALNNA